MKLINGVQSYWEAFINLIFPPHSTCIICRKVSRTEDYGTCQSCLDEVRFVGKGRWLQSGAVYEGVSCRMFSVFQYQGEIRRLIYRLKYSNETYLSREMAKMMTDFIQREGLRVDLLMPIPLYIEKENERGFNQANLLTKYISKETAIPNMKGNLLRNRNTGPMHRLSIRERRDNVRGAFTVKKPEVLRGKHILLVDDILTTGATVEASLKVLLEAGAGEVTVLTFARALTSNE